VPTLCHPNGRLIVKSKSVVISKSGAPEVLELREQVLSSPTAGHILLRTTAIGVNYIDVYFRTGLYPRPLPFVAGLEGAGRVEALGPGVTGLAVGDRVAWSSVPGSYAELVLAPAASVVRVPDGVDDRTAAAAMLQGMTAHYLAHGVRETRPGDVALVHAAAGGAGLLTVQLLARAGATVIGTCSTPAKEALARAAGCAHVVRYTETDFAKEVKRITEGRGVDVVYDSVGRTTFEGSLACLRPRGLLVLFGQSSGPVPPFELGRLNALGSLFITRPSLAHYTQGRAELELRAGVVLRAIEQGELKIRIGAEFPLAEAAAAHRALEGRETTGKVLLIP
jgi:NADPH2:quinone reductase